ncbi:MAG: hypothetical protein HYY16_10260 [Planctomycetes bacterium]|nr:hypothetical protein [Planctomycetota bacterium]
MPITQSLDEALRFTLHGVIFQYIDKPNEWHVCCVENGASGWGHTPDQALHELSLTLGEQLHDTFSTGKNFFFHEPDELWVKVFESGQAPSSEIRVMSRLVGRFEFRPHSRPKRPPTLSFELVTPHRQLTPL